MLYVICGHGAGDSGACAEGLQEQERVRALAGVMKQLAPNEVTILNPDINWYASKMVNAALKSQVGSNPVIELHMDSAGATAKGGHVIIKQGFEADQYDKNLAGFIGNMFPGRSNMIVGRSDLANINRAAANGINYRLLECCFISNHDDLVKFNSRIEDIAKGILGAFGIGSTGTVQSTPAPTPDPQPASKPASKPSYNDWVFRLQRECNRQGFSHQIEDGIPGKNTLAGCPTYRKGAQGGITALLQERLNTLGFNCGKIDGKFGNNTYNAVRSFQKSRGLSDDGVVGQNTWRKLLGL